MNYLYKKFLHKELCEKQALNTYFNADDQLNIYFKYS